jgi:aryl-alcohol dehydrogenase-like predicted oxidoreductase
MITVSKYTFGSMSLGRDPASVETDLAVTRRAMESGVWFHSSPTYNNGFTFMVLRRAFDENRAGVPRMIVKVRDATPELMRFEVEDSCRRLGLEALDVAQLVSMDPAPGNLVDQLRSGGGPLADELASLRERGLIRQAVVYMTPGNADAVVDAVRCSQLVEGITLYWNAVQFESTDTAWSAIHAHDIPVLALRTLGGGMRDKNYAAKADRLQALVTAADCASITEFNLRLDASDSAIRTTIGGTASPEHLEMYLSAARSAVALPDSIFQQAVALQHEREA